MNLNSGRGEGQGYFASRAGGVGSIPTPGSEETVAHWVERLCPWPFVPVQQIFVNASAAKMVRRRKEE
jgi:hypothetical protein